MSDFDLTLIDWGLLQERYESENLEPVLGQAMEARDFETASNVSQEFIGSIARGEGSVSAHSIFPRSFEMESTGPWSAFGATYSVLRGWIPSEISKQFDDIYFPMISHWIDFNPKIHPPFHLPDSMKHLRMGGLTLAMSPEHCIRLAETCRTHTFSYLIHCVACHKKEAFPLPRYGSWFNPLLDSGNLEMMAEHASYTSATEGWRKLVCEAARREKGIIYVVQI